ncbi:MAG: CARDB domain-containing protein, partial [Thermoplasmata archaeon]
RFNLTVSIVEKQDKYVTVQGTFNVKEKIELSISSAGQTSRDASKTSPSDVEFSFSVSNNGNARVTVLPVVEDSPSGWKDMLSFSPASAPVEFGSSQRFTLKVPASLITQGNAGSHTIQVKAVTADGVQSGTITFTVYIKQALLKIVSITASGTLQKNSKDLVLNITIRNEGDAPSAAFSLFVKDSTGAPIGSSILVESIPAGSTKSVTVPWSPVTDGTQAVRVEIPSAAQTQQETFNVNEEPAGISTYFTSLKFYVGVGLASIIWLILLIIVIIIMKAGKETPTVVLEKPTGAAPAPPQKTPPSKGAAAPKPPAAAPPAQAAAPEPSTAAAPAPPQAAKATAPASAPPATPAGIIAKVTCPKCKKPTYVESQERPIEVKCEYCGARMRLKK